MRSTRRRNGHSWKSDVIPVERIEGRDTLTDTAGALHGSTRMCRTMSPCGPSAGHAVARIVRSPLHRHGPLQYRPQALTHGPRRLRLDVPDRREDLQHVRAVDLGHRPLADARERVPLQAPQLLAAPAAALLLDDAPGGFGVRGNALRAPLVGERVTAGASQLAVGEGNVADLGERDGAEAQLTSSAADDELLDPAPVPSGLT